MKLRLLLASAPLVLSAASAQAFFIDGDGHYALRGETRVAPGFSKENGTYQAVEQSFRLQGEARASDNLSMFLELRLWDNPRDAYLGDQARPRECPPSPTGTTAAQPADPNDPCAGKPQSTGEPGYEPYKPVITKAYARYAFDYCLLEAGRRGRDWGLGIFLDSGKDPFDQDASIFDGVTCNVNIQKSQTLGFSVGYDKLAETGTYIDPADAASGTRKFGPNDSGDDIDQLFFTIEYDDRKANAGAPFTKNIGVYFAQVNSRPLKKGGSNTDLKFFDLYTGFFLSDLAIKNEILFRMGKSADPNWQALGGKVYESGAPATNKLQSIGFAGEFAWTLSRSGAALGPAEYNQGDASSHSVFLSYAYAPGDSDGYYTDRTPITCNDETGAGCRKKDVTAMAFHRNYKPALILFNERADQDDLAVDGAFNPSRVENATVIGAGYRYDSTQNGSVEAKLITASLNQGIPSDVKDYYTANPTVTRPIGYGGKNLGVELDVSYGYKIGREAELGVAAAAAIPGNAWKVKETEKPANDFLIQSYAAFKF